MAGQLLPGGMYALVDDYLGATFLWDHANGKYAAWRMDEIRAQSSSKVSAMRSRTIP